MDIKALILDADGLLTQPFLFTRYLEREHPAIVPQLGEFFSGVFQECLVGQANLRLVLPPYLVKWGWPHSVDDFLERWFEEEKGVDEQVLAVVGLVQAKGIPCYVATNQEQHRTDYMRTQMGFDVYFDGLFSSCELGFPKPERAFYEAIQRELNLPGEQILFWDDTPRNVTAAIVCGWQAEHYTDFPDFAYKLRTTYQLLD